MSKIKDVITICPECRGEKMLRVSAGMKDCPKCLGTGVVYKEVVSGRV